MDIKRNAERFGCFLFGVVTTVLVKKVMHKPSARSIPAPTADIPRGPSHVFTPDAPPRGKTGS